MDEFENVSHHSEAGEGSPAGLQLAGAAHSVALALNLHVPLKQLKKVWISFALKFFICIFLSFC